MNGDERELRRELSAAQDRVMLQQRELDRLRALTSEARIEHHTQLENASRAAAEAEARATRSESGMRDLEQKLHNAEREAREAWAQQERHAATVKEVRTQVAQRMDSLVQALHDKEEELHRVQYQLRERERDRTRVQQLEKMLASRDASLDELATSFSQLRTEHDTLVVQHAAARSQSVRDAHMSSHFASPRESSPPPPPPANDPHVLETAHVVVQCRDWCQETDRAVVGLEDVVEAQFDALQDLRLVLERGASNVGSDAIGSAAAHLDRQRLAQLRRTEQRRLDQQMAAVSDGASTAGLIKAVMANARFNFGKLKNTLDQVTDYIGQLRQLTDRHCGQAGLPTMASRWDQWAKARPEPLPMPGMNTPPNALSPTAPSSPAGGAPLAGNGSMMTSPPPQQPSSGAGHVATLVTERDEALKRARSLEEQLDTVKEQLREARRDRDNDTATARHEHRAEVDRLRHAADEERQSLQTIIDKMRVETSAVRRDADDELTTLRRQHSDEVHKLEQDRSRIIGDLQGRIAATERELEEALASKLRDQGALDEAKTKRKALKMDYVEARDEARRLASQVTELVRDVEDAHRHIDGLEAELSAAKSALDFEVQQQEEARLEAASFHQWKGAAAHVAAAAEAARGHSGKVSRAAGFAAGPAEGPPAAQPRAAAAFVRRGPAGASSFGPKTPPAFR